MDQAEDESETPKTFEVRFVASVEHWILFEDGIQTDSWIIGLTKSASDELIQYAISEQFYMYPDDEFSIIRD